MRNEPSKSGTFTDLLESGWVTKNTSAVLKARLDTVPTVEPVFFAPEIFHILQSVCDQLIPQVNKNAAVDLAGLVDKRLYSGHGKGWRYNKMPADKISFHLGLKGINESALYMFNKEFTALEDADKNNVLQAVQKGMATGQSWEHLPPEIFFEELLALVTELFYSHPFAKEDIDDVSFADAKGWTRIGLNESENYEPK